MHFFLSFNREKGKKKKGFPCRRHAALQLVSFHHLHLEKDLLVHRIHTIIGEHHYQQLATVSHASTDASNQKLQRCVNGDFTISTSLPAAHQHFYHHQPFLSTRNLPPVSTSSNHRHARITACSYSKSKRALLEHYGLNPDDFLSEPKPMGRKRREEDNTDEEPAKVERTNHRLLQVLGGKAKRKKLLSPKGMDVRPMMEVVKGSAFDILQVAGGCPASLRPGRWLDLYSGTGSVGIEAISRGCSEVHFVEMDPWVVSNVLRPNLETTGFLDVSVIHTQCVENFLAQAEQFVGRNRPLDFISVTPPYMKVDYTILMNQLSRSPLLGEDTFIVVEYPLRTDMLDTCGCLIKITDRRFGRTHLAIYGPKWAQKVRKSEKTIRREANPLANE